MSRYVDLDERVTAQFYDQEYEEWTMRTVTVEDVLNSVCDEYTVLPSAQPELTEEERRQIKKLRSFHNGTYAKVLDKLMAFASAQPTPCDVCRHNPPSSMDGKPCCVCPAERREE